MTRCVGGHVKGIWKGEKRFEDGRGQRPVAVKNATDEKKTFSDQVTRHRSRPVLGNRECPMG